MYSEFVRFVRTLYDTEDFIPLHAPTFSNKEKEYVCDAIDTTFVSSVSEYVDRFEQQLRDFTGAPYAISVMNGTAAIHLALNVIGVRRDMEILTESLTFVATCNSIKHIGATPVFVDVDRETLGMCPDSLRQFLNDYAEKTDSGVVNKHTGKKIGACMPMHTFGHPLKIEKVIEICQEWHIPVIEEAAEAIGSYYQDRHCGTFADLGVLSFNGNKIITTGGGGAVLTNNQQLAERIKHLSTTAKRPHAWEYIHDEIGYNFRLPGLNAAMGCGQLDSIHLKLDDKRKITQSYAAWAETSELEFVHEPEGARSNYWLNAFVLKDRQTRDEFLEFTNANGIMTRPCWRPMHLLDPFKDCFRGPLDVTEQLYDTLVNVPSGARV